MSIGRNDPCPCGSGKKYKQCCWLKDRQAERPIVKPAVMAEPPFSPTEETEIRPRLGSLAPPPQSAARTEVEEEPDPEREFWDKFWDEWQAADYEQQLDITEKMLREQPELVEGGLAFEMFADLHTKASINEDWARFDLLVDLLIQQAPASYEAEKHYFLGWRIENALVSGNRTSVRELFNALATLAGQEIDEFNRIAEKLAYHGELSSLVSGYRIARPEVEASPQIVPWGVSEFVDQAFSYETFSRLEQQPDLQADDAELLSLLRTELNTKNFTEYLDYLSGRQLPRWTLEDCTLPPIPPKQKGAWKEDEEESANTAPESDNLHLLTIAFIHDWHIAEGTSYSKAELARSQIIRYLVERQRGDLEPVDKFPFSQGQKKKERKKLSSQSSASHPLCPDPQTLNRYMVLLIGFLSGRLHTAGAMLEAVPAWIRFLEKYDLLDGDQATEALASLKKLAADWMTAVETATSDPLLLANAIKLHESL